MSSIGSENQLRRVVISGLGIISPVGDTLDELWQSLTSGKSGVRKLSTQGLPFDFGAEAVTFDGKIECFGELDKDQKKAIRKGLKVMCRECQMGVASAQKALADAKITPGTFEPGKIGVSFGSDYMLSVPEEFNQPVARSCNGDGQFDFARWPSEGLPQMSPLWLLKYLPNMPASHIAIYNDFRGPSNSITIREASADMSIGEAFRIVAEGRADAMLTGATGTRLHPMKMIHVLQQSELAENSGDPARASRPFDLNRTGMVAGEGAGTVILESLESATARGATIYAEVIGRASSMVASPHLTSRGGKAIENVLRVILENAGLEPNQIGHIQAHGLGTKTSDAEEAQAIAAVFGENGVPVTTIKGHSGNLGAGSGAVELAAGILALQNGSLFPTLNYETPDPACPVRVPTDTTTPSGENFIHLSITPQGQAAAVLVKRYV